MPHASSRALICSSHTFLHPAPARAPPLLPHFLSAAAPRAPATQDGKTSLHIAAQLGWVSFIDKLIEAGANIHAKDNTVRSP